MKALHHPKPDARRAPREPMYTFQEVAERLGTTPGRAHSLMGHYPGLDHVRSVAGGMQVKVKARLYRMSVARAWWATVPPHMKVTQ